MPYDASKHLIRVQGNREYLPVAQRLVWFREEHPDWGIETSFELLDVEAGLAVCRATIRDESGRIRATATKLETAKGFPDFSEKAETGSIGRALALVGYGTQFADLDEGGHADSPQPPGQRESVVCQTEGCGVILTKGQADYSDRHFGQRLCPACQKKQPT